MCRATSSTNDHATHQIQKIRHSSTALVQQGAGRPQESNTLSYLPPAHAFCLHLHLRWRIRHQLALCRPHQPHVSVPCRRECLYELLQARQLQVPLHNPCLTTHESGPACVHKAEGNRAPCGPPAITTPCSLADTSVMHEATHPSHQLCPDSKPHQRAVLGPCQTLGRLQRLASPYSVHCRTRFITLRSHTRNVHKHSIPVVELFGEPAAHKSVQTKPG